MEKEIRPISLLVSKQCCQLWLFSTKFIQVVVGKIILSKSWKHWQRTSPIRIQVIDRIIVGRGKSEQQ